ncbi:Mur ligase family protein, partial [Rhizobium ruizarguesonis]
PSSRHWSRPWLEAAKMRLFDTLLPKGSQAVIFADDPWSAQAIKAATDAGHDVRNVGRKGNYLSLKSVEHFRHKQMAEIHIGGEIF